MGLIFCVVFFALGGILAQWKLAHGIGFVIAVGCIYGWLRCYFFDGFTHYSFDAALLGLYLGAYPKLRAFIAHDRTGLTQWVALLGCWPLFVVIVSPFLDAQPLIIQIVGLRNAVLFLPALLVGALLRSEDLNVLGAWCAAIAFGEAAFAGGELMWGLQAAFPDNAASSIIYISRDVAGTEYRIPASFSSAHAYGGTMVAIIPFLVHLLTTGKGWRSVTLAALTLAAIGVFVCGARTPVIALWGVLGGAIYGLRRRPGLVVGLVGAAFVVVLVVRESDRLQRFESLSDSELVERRVGTSVNLSFFEIVATYPLGKGLGGATGTSVPFFLEDVALPQVGMENEFGRLALEEGLIGLVLWATFVIWALFRGPGRLMRFGGASDQALWALAWTAWILSFIGTGTLSRPV